MPIRSGMLLALLALPACAASTADNPAEANKTLVRQLIDEADSGGGSLAYIDKYLAPEYRLHLNGTTMDLAGYRALAGSVFAAFSNVRHEIQQILAEGDLVAVVISLHLTHTGDYEGIKPTGRTVTLPEIIVARIRDGRIVEEWAAVDLGSLTTQLTAATPAR